MISIEKTIESFNNFIIDLRAELAREVEQRIEKQLEVDVEAWLHRGYHERREQVGNRQGGAQCQRCGTRHARQFSRNGHRYRFQFCDLINGCGMMCWSKLGGGLTWG